MNDTAREEECFASLKYVFNLFLLEFNTTAEIAYTVVNFMSIKMKGHAYYYMRNWAKKNNFICHDDIITTKNGKVVININLSSDMTYLAFNMVHNSSNGSRLTRLQQRDLNTHVEYIRTVYRENGVSNTDISRFDFYRELREMCNLFIKNL